MLITSPINTEMTFDETSTSAQGDSVVVLLAIQQVAKKYLIREVEIKEQIARALLSGHLFVRDAEGLPYQPPECDLSVEKIRFEDLNGHFASHGHDYRLYLGDVAELGETSSADLSPFATPRISVNVGRIQKIRSFFEAQGLDPMNIPFGGKKAAKRHLTEKLKLCSPGGFEETWKAACGKLVRTAGHETYGKRHR